MSLRLEPGVFTEILTAVEETGQIKADVSAQRMAAACVLQAKINVSTGRHEYGTPTPASEGAGPAQISGTLFRCIISTPVIAADDSYTAMVGPEPGHYTPYGIPKHHIKPDPKPRADSARYGYYLETGDWGHTYPWLGPALRMVERVSGPVILRQVFAGGWPSF